jgi:hypothetical protein
LRSSPPKPGGHRDGDVFAKTHEHRENPIQGDFAEPTPKDLLKIGSIHTHDLSGLGLINLSILHNSPDAVHQFGFARHLFGIGTTEIEVDVSRTFLGDHFFLAVPNSPWLFRQ